MSRRPTWPVSDRQAADDTLAAQTPICTCQTHRGQTPALEIGGHRYGREHAPYVDPILRLQWRWVCQCGVTGHWRPGSANAVYHGWATHAVRARRVGFVGQERGEAS